MSNLFAALPRCKLPGRPGKLELQSTKPLDPLVAMPGAPSSFLFLVVRPGAPSSVLAPTSDGLQPTSMVEFKTPTDHQVWSPSCPGTIL